MKDKKLRILFITNLDLGQPDGELVTFVNLANALTKRGHEVLFLSPLPRGIKLIPPKKCLFVPRISLRYIRYFTFTFLLPFYLLYALFSFRPNVIIYRGYDAVPYLFAYLFSKIFNIPICHNYGGIPQRRFPIRWSVRILLDYLHWLAQKNSYLIVDHSNSDEVERVAIKEKFPLSRLASFEGPALDPKIFYPIDMKKARSKLGLPLQTYILFFSATEAGTCNYNLKIMLFALKKIIQKCPDSLLIIAGEIHPRYKKSFLKLVDEEGLTEKALITGYLSQESLNLYINASDVCLLPIIREHLERNKISGATKLWEYFGCARPVVKSDLEECWTYNWFKDISLIVPPDDEESLAQALIQLYGNPSLRKELGEKAYRWVLENHTWDKRAEKIERFLKWLLKDRK